ncbi:S8 family serine peptidase [Enterobacter soli]|uniref:S8 family serine peptidase n=1 Tax=Enterobacter soli TaxID=885040 RepID=UPI0034CEF4D3
MQLAQQGVTYTAIVVKLKPSKPLLKSTGTATTTTTTATAKLTLSDPSLVPEAMFKPKLQSTRTSQTSEFTELNARYGFDRYLRIEIPENKSTDKEYINNVIAELERNQNVEVVYPESLPVSMDEMSESDKQAPALLKSSVQSTVGASAIPDYRYKQDYLRSPTEKRASYYMGGVNRDSVNQYPGSAGEGVTIISMENYIWNTNHVNLPKPALVQGNGTYNGDHHDTASVGIMAATDIGTGMRGLAWKSRVGFASWQSNNLYNMIPLLKAGDVVQMGMQTGGGEVAGCTTNTCYVPQENVQSYYDIIKALTDKGVYVIEAAGNGNVNLDHPGFNGKFNVQTRDSGAIIAGAFCAKEGTRASFSTYGSRVTSSSWGCFDVATTGYGSLNKVANAEYTHAFSGTSASNPIIAGVVASLSGIAKANGITVTPVQMRQILQETGTPLAEGDSAKVGTQPDMERAVAKILALKNGGETLPAPTAVAGADYTMVSPATGVSVYPLDGSKSLNAKSYTWSVTKGSGTFFVEEKLNGNLVNSVDGAHAYAVIPANTEGESVYTLTTTGADGRTAQDSMTIKVSKPAVPAKDDTPSKDETPAKDDTPSKDETPAKDDTPAKDTTPAYNAKIAYPTKCTKVAHNGKIWFNQWYVNPGQEEPGKGGTWGAWREQGASGNSCK